MCSASAAGPAAPRGPLEQSEFREHTAGADATDWLSHSRSERGTRPSWGGGSVDTDMPTPVKESQEGDHVPKGVPERADTDMPAHVK